MKENEEKKVRIKYKLSKKSKIILWVLVISLFVAIIASFGISAYVGWNLTHPTREKLATDPSSVGLKYEDVTFKSTEDNVVIKGWLTTSAQNLKTIIFSHGYNNNRLQRSMPTLPLAKDLVDNGYNVLLFDFRNSGESEGKLTSVGQFEVRDLMGAYNYINSRNDISHEVIFYGFSMGGSVSIIAGANEPGVSGVIADSPFSDLKTYLNSNLTQWTKLPEVPFNTTFFMIVPMITGIDLNAVSPLKDVQKFGDKPLLLIHSEDDEKIPYENSVAIKKAYDKAQLYSTKGAKHVKSYMTDRENYMKRVLGFLNGL